MKNDDRIRNANRSNERRELLRKRRHRRVIRRRIAVGVLLALLVFVFISSVAMRESGGDSEVKVEEEYSTVRYNVLHAYRHELVSEEKFKIDPEKPMIALTFDDGPGKYTNQLLDAVEANNVHVTFFMLGNNITEQYGDTLHRMAQLGCELSNHSKNHADFRKLSADEIKDQVSYTNGKIEKYIGEGGRNFRPPYGAVDSKVQENVGMPMILWTVDTLDWKHRDVKKVVKAMTTDIEDGDIILLHDIHKTSVEAVAVAIPMLLEQGFQLVTVEEMAVAKGVTLENGEKYFSF